MSLVEVAQGSRSGRVAKSLRGVQILKDLSPKEIAAIDATCRWREVDAGEQIMDTDDSSGEVYFVVRGSVRVLNFSATGQQVGFADFGPGGHFGELSAIDGGPRSAKVYAQKDTLVGVMDRAGFTKLLKERHEVALRLLVHLAGVIRTLDDRVLDISAMSDVQRVYHELLRISEPSPEGNGSWLIFHMPRHKDLAEAVGTTPEVVAHAVSQLMKAELVRRRSGVLELLDKKRIQQLAVSG